MKLKIELIESSPNEGITGGWTVTYGDKYADALGYDEMLGLVAAITLPEERPNLAWLKTEENHNIWRNQVYKNNVNTMENNVNTPEDKLKIQEAEMKLAIVWIKSHIDELKHKEKILHAAIGFTREFGETMSQTAITLAKDADDYFKNDFLNDPTFP